MLIVKTSSFCLALAVGICAVVRPSSGAVYYVAPDGVGDGSSWDTAANFEAAYAAADLREPRHQPIRRSCKQNIAEGSASSGTSKETEIKLTNVARASLDELFEDYEDYLKSHELVRWPSTDRKYVVARAKAIANPDWSFWKPIFASRTAETICNLQLTLIRQTQSLLDGMIKRQEADFKKLGGVRERMHAARTAARSESWDKAVYSYLESALTAADLDARVAEIRRKLARTAWSIKQRKAW